MFYNKKYDEIYGTYYAGQSINIKRKLFYEFLSVDSKEELKKRGIVVKTVKKMKSRAQILKVKNQKQAETEHQKRLMNIENNLGLKSVRSMKDIYVNVKNSPISQIKASGQMHMTPLSGVFLKPEDEKGKLSTKSESAKEIKPAQIDLKNTKLT